MTATAGLVGPVQGGRGWPFGAPAFDVGAFGYVMEEFLAEGTATSYRLADGAEATDDGHWDTVPDSSRPYRTRLYVVRPSDPATFNGVVLVNWQNVTAGVDLGAPSEADLHHGFAWVGVTTQHVAIDGQPAIAAGLAATEGLPVWDPKRYGTLSHPGDAFSYDIFSQAARTLPPDGDRSPDPLGGLVPRRLIAVGGSQSAMRLGSYINIAHQRDRVFDGFLPTVHWGICPYPPDQPLIASWMPVGGGRFAGSARIRDDGTTPILVVTSESETMHNYPVRQPDSDTFRFWELAGTAHSSPESAAAIAPILARDGLAALPQIADRNSVAWDYVRDAALARLVEWVDGGHAPKSFPRIEVDPGPPAAIRRDGLGNALGGIRLPDLEAPVATHSGTNQASPVAALSGQSIPIPPDELRRRYPTPEIYLEAWNAAVDRLVADELILSDAVSEVRARGQMIAHRHWP